MRAARCVSFFLLMFFCVLSDKAVRADWRSGLGAAMQDIAESMRQDMEMERQKELIRLQYDLEIKRMQLQHDLEMQRTTLPPPAAQPTAITATEANSQGLAAYHQEQYVQAMQWFRKAAGQGNATAQFNLGVMYANGRGVPQDYVEALIWYRLAADHGDAAAQNNLGEMYKKGQGVPQNYAEAAKWYRKAADQGNTVGQFNLGEMYAKGRGVAKDATQAREWFGLAAQQGQPNAIRWLAQNPRQPQPTQQQPVAAVTPPIAQPPASKIATLGRIVESYPQYGYVVFRVTNPITIGTEVLAQSSSGNLLKMLVQKRVNSSDGTLISATVPNGISQLSKGDKVVQPTP